MSMCVDDPTANRDPGYEMLQNQVTLAQWHLDAALSAQPDIARVHLHRAQEAYTQALTASARADLNPDERSDVHRRLEALRSRMESARDA